MQQLLFTKHANRFYPLQKRFREAIICNILKCSSKMMSSDHLLFGTSGIMITKLNRSKYLNDYYIPNIPTNMDKQFDNVNIEIVLELIEKITGES